MNQHLETSGWFWNPGYRTTSQYLTSVERSPGIGVAARELYNRGLGRPRTTRQSILVEASPVAARIYRLAKSLGADHPTAQRYVSEGLDFLRKKGIL